jgi:hypothetical protein
MEALRVSWNELSTSLENRAKYINDFRTQLCNLRRAATDLIFFCRPEIDGPLSDVVGSIDGVLSDFFAEASDCDLVPFFSSSSSLLSDLSRWRDAISRLFADRLAEREQQHQRFIDWLTAQCSDADRLRTIRDLLNCPIGDYTRPFIAHFNAELRAALNLRDPTLPIPREGKRLRDSIFVAADFFLVTTEVRASFQSASEELPIIEERIILHRGELFTDPEMNFTERRRAAMERRSEALARELSQLGTDNFAQARRAHLREELRRIDEKLHPRPPAPPIVIVPEEPISNIADPVQSSTSSWMRFILVIGWLLWATVECWG